MKKKFLTIVGVAAFAGAVAVNISAGLKSANEVDITLRTLESSAQRTLESSTESGIQSEGSSHGRPLMKSSSGAYKCANCSGSDCGAAC